MTTPTNNQIADEPEPCPFCGGAPEVSTSDDSGDDWYRVECLCGATVGGSHVYDCAVTNWNRRAALREEGGERGELEQFAFAEMSGAVYEYVRLRNRTDTLSMESRMHRANAAANAWANGDLGALARLRSQAAVHASDGVSAMQLADSAGDLCANVYVGRRDDALSAGDLCACGHRKDVHGDNDICWGLIDGTPQCACKVFVLAVPAQVAKPTPATVSRNGPPLAAPAFEATATLESVDLEDASKPSESDEFVEAIYDILCNYRTQTREDCRAVAHKIADLPERTPRIN